VNIDIWRWFCKKKR